MSHNHWLCNFPKSLSHDSPQIVLCKTWEQITKKEVKDLSDRPTLLVDLIHSGPGILLELINHSTSWRIHDSCRDDIIMMSFEFKKRTRDLLLMKENILDDYFFFRHNSPFEFWILKCLIYVSSYDWTKDLVWYLSFKMIFWYIHIMNSTPYFRLVPDWLSDSSHSFSHPVIFISQYSIWHTVMPFMHINGRFITYVPLILCVFSNT